MKMFFCRADELKPRMTILTTSQDAGPALAGDHKMESCTIYTVETVKSRSIRDALKNLPGHDVVRVTYGRNKGSNYRAYSPNEMFVVVEPKE